MKKILFLLCGFVAACLMFSDFAAGQKQLSQIDSKADDVGQLTQQVSSLQAKIKTLEERLAKLEKNGTIKLVNSPLVANPAPNSITIPGAGVESQSTSECLERT